MNIYEELQWRGLIADSTFEIQATATNSANPTSPEPAHAVDPQKIFTLYCGFDPTSNSLHVGNLVPLLTLRRFQIAGHHPIAVAGGATGLIGDPSGKSQERQLLTREVLNSNIDGVKSQLAKLLDFNSTTNPAQLLDNASWTSNISFLEFLRDTGKHFSVNMMVSKESVRARMEDRESGISYTEFSYMLLQAFDFYVLCRDHNCELQIGGTDQWGNITAGIDLCRKRLSRQACGLVVPLITNADGTKFGKTVSGAVWLDPNKTSVYRFYQFWINTDDRDVVRYLKFFTFLDQNTVAQLESAHQSNPGAREAHKALALQVTNMIHGETATQDAIRASEILFGAPLDQVNESTIQQLLTEIPTCTLPASRLQDPGIPLPELLAEAKLSNSKGQARKDIEGGGAYINNTKEPNPQRHITTNDLLFNQYLLLRKGKKNYALLHIQP
jgi:tyrosyl-tRNA synthetase